MRDVVPCSDARKTKGSYSLEICAFHDDHNPSMMLTQNRYHCFACGASGDVIDWTIKTSASEMSFLEACEALQSPRNERRTVMPNRKASRVVNNEINDSAKVTYSTDEVLRYCQTMTADDYALLQKATGWNRDSCQHFRIGTRHRGSKMYTIPIPAEDNNDVYVDIKVYNPLHKLNGFIKYWHLNKGQGKRNTLFNALAAKDADTVFIAEGEKDAINMHQLGLIAVSGTSGCSAIMKEWATMLANVKKIYVVMDNDEPGRIAAGKWLRMIRRSIIFDWRVLPIAVKKKGFDFSDFVKEGGTKEQFLSVVSKVERYWTP